MQFRVTDLMIEATTKKKKKGKAVSRYCCGERGTCYGCTRCTSTSASVHKSAITLNTCNALSDLEIRGELLAQLREILAVPNEYAQRERAKAA